MYLNLNIHILIALLVILYLITHNSLCPDNEKLFDSKKIFSKKFIVSLPSKILNFLPKAPQKFFDSMSKLLFAYKNFIVQVQIIVWSLLLFSYIILIVTRYSVLVDKYHGLMDIEILFNGFECPLWTLYVVPVAYVFLVLFTRYILEDQHDYYIHKAYRVTRDIFFLIYTLFLMHLMLNYLNLNPVLYDGTYLSIKLDDSEWWFSHHVDAMFEFFHSDQILFDAKKIVYVDYDTKMLWREEWLSLSKVNSEFYGVDTRFKDVNYFLELKYIETNTPLTGLWWFLDFCNWVVFGKTSVFPR